MTNSEALLTFGLHESTPHWSSESLRRYLRDAAAGGDTLEDAVISLVVLLGERDGALTPELAHFIKDFVVICFTEHREAYEMLAWDKLTALLAGCRTQTLCYFAVLAVPQEHLTIAQLAAIIKVLDNTPYQHEAAIVATT